MEPRIHNVSLFACFPYRNHFVQILTFPNSSQNCPVHLSLVGSPLRVNIFDVSPPKRKTTPVGLFFVVTLNKTPFHESFVKYFPRMSLTVYKMLGFDLVKIWFIFKETGSKWNSEDNGIVKKHLRVQRITFTAKCNVILHVNWISQYEFDSNITSANLSLDSSKNLPENVYVITRNSKIIFNESATSCTSTFTHFSGVIRSVARPKRRLSIRQRRSPRGIPRGRLIAGDSRQGSMSPHSNPGPGPGRGLLRADHFELHSPIGRAAAVHRRPQKVVARWVGERERLELEVRCSCCCSVDYFGGHVGGLRLLGGLRG